MSGRWPLLAADNQQYAEVLEQMARDRLHRELAVMEADDELPATAVEFLVANSVWAVGLPEEHGGAGAGLEAVALAVAIVATALPAAALALADAHVVAATALGCADGLGGPVLEAIASGALVCVLDGVSPLVKATLQQTTDGWKLELDARRAEWATSAVSALALADTDGALITPPVWDRRVCGPLLQRTGMRGAPPCAVRLVGAVLSDDARSTVRPSAVRGVRLLLLSATAVGLMLSAERYGRDYAAERRQFGATLDSIAVVREKLDAAGGAIRHYQASLIATARALEEGSSRADVDAAELASRITAQAVHTAIEVTQVFGGYGYLADYPIARVVRDAVTLRAITAGSLGLGQQVGAVLA